MGVITTQLFSDAGLSAWLSLSTMGYVSRNTRKHVTFADPRRYWDFRSLGHGDIKFEDIIVALNDVGYQGPLSVEWEDSRMDREHGATEACEFVKKIDFAPSTVAFDAAFSKDDR